MIQMDLANLSKVLRAKRISHRELCNMTGMGENLVSLICKGRKKDIYLSTAMKVSKALNMTIEDIFTIKDPDRNPDSKKEMRL